MSNLSIKSQNSLRLGQRLFSVIFTQFSAAVSTGKSFKMHTLWIEKYLLERCVFCLVCSVSFPVMNLCQIQQCATVFSELIASVYSVLALWRLKSLLKL